MPRALLLLLLPLLLGAVPVPLTVHLSVTRTDTARAWIDRQVAVANQRFASAGARFEVRRWLAFDSPGPQITDVAGRDALARRVGGERAVHVFVVDRLANKDRSGSWIGGVHWRRGGRRYVIVSRGEALADTLAHELGHFLGLGHTRSPSNLMTSPGRREGAGLERWQLRRVRARLGAWALRRGPRP